MSTLADTHFLTEDARENKLELKRHHRDFQAISNLVHRAIMDYEEAVSFGVSKDKADSLYRTLRQIRSIVG